MSLVNDMLRDLDQRRKETDGSDSSVRLFPASEHPKEESKNFLPFVLIGLVVVAAGLGYYWFQLDQSNESQQLDIQIQPGTPLASAASEPENSVAVEQGVIARTDATDSTNIGSTDNADIQNSQPILQDSLSDTRDQTEQAVEVAQEPLQQVEETVQAVASNEALTTSNLDQDSIANEAVADLLPVTEEVSESVQPTASDDTNSDQVASAELVRSGSGETVKDVAELSPEQQDMTAVQQALRLIAENQNDEAYSVLEEQISSNRYAHQSRETYAKLLMSQGAVQQAYDLTDAGLTLAPNHTGFKKVKARLLINNGQVDDAVSLLLSRAPAVSEDLEYHEILALAQLTSRDYQGASISYSGLVGEDQTQGRWWYGYAASQDSLGNLTVALQAYNRAIQYGNLSANLRRRSQDRIDFLGQ